MIDDMEAYRCQLTQEDTTAMSILEPVNLSLDYLTDPGHSQVHSRGASENFAHSLATNDGYSHSPLFCCACDRK